MVHTKQMLSKVGVNASQAGRELGEERWRDGAFSATHRYTYHSALRPQVGLWRTQSVLCRLQTSAVTPQQQTPLPIIRTTLSPMNRLSFFPSTAHEQVS